MEAALLLLATSIHKSNWYEPNSLSVEHYSSWPLQCADTVHSFTIEPDSLSNRPTRGRAS